MEFLVHMQVKWPPDGDSDTRAALIAAEAERASKLARAGTISRLWRIPGQWANWGLWNAAGPDELHAAISSLPMYPWLSVTVHPLATHPSDPRPKASR
jgi:muconolactone D-isomerase